MVWAAGRCDPQGPGLTGGGEPAYPCITEVPWANRGAAQRAIASPAGQPRWPISPSTPRAAERGPVKIGFIYPMSGGSSIPARTC